MDTPEILLLAKPLGTEFWCEMWAMTTSNEERVRKNRKGKGKRGRMKVRLTILIRCTFRPGKEKLEAFVLYLPGYEINTTLHSPASCLTSSQSSSASKESAMGHVCWGCFGMRDVYLWETSSWQENRVWWRAWWVPDLPRCSPWHLLICEGRPGCGQAPSPSAPKCILREHVCTCSCAHQQLA